MVSTLDDVHLLLMEIRDMVSVFQRDQPAISTTAIPTPLPPVTLGFRQFWLGLACVGIAVGIAVCTPFDLVSSVLDTKSKSIVSVSDPKILDFSTSLFFNAI